MMDNEINFYSKSKMMEYNDSNSVYRVDRYHYSTPLTSRYSSEEMSYNFSDMKRYQLWRKLWVYLAKAQKELGVPFITNEMIKEMESNIEEIDFDFIEEDANKHDVIAHLNEFTLRCPKSAKVISLGATGSFVVDNTNLILIRDGIEILIPKLANCIDKLFKFSLKYKDLPTISYTHLNPAQSLITLGKRTCVWMNDLLSDLNSLNQVREKMLFNFPGCKSNTGTCDTYLEIFYEDKDNVKKLEKLEQLIAEYAGFKKSHPLISNDRKIELDILSILANLGSSVHKMCTDIRLLCGFKVLEEPLDANSHLAHKHNPMKSERCCAIARNLFATNLNALNTSSVQWLERSGDDSILKRCLIPEAFISGDIILTTLQSLLTNLVVNIPIVRKIVNQELAFLPTCRDRLIDAMERKGFDSKQSRLKIVSLQSRANVDMKERALDYNLIEIISKDEFFLPIKEELTQIFDPQNYVGLAVQQVESFLFNEVKPIISQFIKE